MNRQEQNDSDNAEDAKRKENEKPLSTPSSDVSVIRNDRSFISETQEYDREALLTTKRKKVLKKRNNRMVAGDTSSMESNEQQKSHQPLNLQSDDQSMKPSISTNKSNTSSIIYSSSDTLQFDSDDSPVEASHSLPPGRSLVSGVAFIYMVIPPDGGWGWIILLVSFLAQIIIDGIIFTIGILLPYMAKDFGVPDAKIVLVAAVQMGCYFTGGAISGALINTYGFRPIAMAGVVLASIALVGATFSQNMTTMIIAYSVFGGQGLSMIWASSQLIIGYYFEQYRPIASGISCSGAGAGMVTFSVLNNNILPIIGWRNTTRLHVIFLIIIFFMAMTYVEVMPVPVGIVHSGHMNVVTSSDEYYGTVHNFFMDAHAQVSKKSILEQYEPERKRPGYFKRFLTKCSCLCRKKRQSIEKRDSKHTVDSMDEHYVVRRDPLQRQDIFYTGRPEYAKKHSKEQVEGKEVELVGTDKHMASTAYGLSHIHEYGQPDRAQKQRERGFKLRHPCLAWLSPKTWLHPKIRRALKLLFDFHLFKHFEFRFLVASAFLYPMGFNIPFVYAKARTTIPPEYASLIGPSIGLTNFLMRILCGFIAYRYRPQSTVICGGGLVFGGSFVFLSAFYGQSLIWFQFVYGLCYGVAPAVYSTLRAILYVRYLGLRNLTNAFGITALAMGLGVFIGTWFAGVLNDATGDYTAAFAFAGVCIMSSGLVILILPQLVARRQPPEDEANKDSTI